VKKAYISPVTSLLMSLSLALGILVSDLRGYRLLTSAHAQQGSPCGVSENDATVVSDTVNIEDGFILSGIAVRNVTVNGSVLDQAVIAGIVQISDATVVGSTSIIYTGGEVGAGQGGVLVGSDSPCTNGVLVGSDSPAINGVLVGSDSPSPTLTGVTGSASGTAVGGMLTGDNITINDGVVTGQNLLLSGATFNDGSISGTITSISIRPIN
jgi:hypothetical protein